MKSFSTVFYMYLFGIDLINVKTFDKRYIFVHLCRHWSMLEIISSSLLFDLAHVLLLTTILLPFLLSNVFGYLAVSGRAHSIVSRDHCAMLYLGC